MSESQHSSISHRPNSITSKISLLGWLSIVCLLMTPTLSLVQATPSPIIASDVTIKNPKLNGVINSTSVTISGTYVSPSNPPVITAVVDGASYSASVVSSSITTGTWSVGISTSNGWHTLRVKMTDTNGVISDSSNFFTNNGATIIPQIKYQNVTNIEYSQACASDVARGDYSNCPPLSKLMPYDTSIQKYSGYFVPSKNGDYIRTKPQLQNAYQFYKQPTTCVECFIDANALSQMQNIIVEPTGFSYTQHTFFNSLLNRTNPSSNGNVTYSTTTINENVAGFVVYHDKWVTPDCMTAEVVYKDENTIPSTLAYLKGGCKDPNFYNTTTTKLGNTPFSFNNNYSTLHYDSYLKQIFHGVSQLHNEKMATGGGLGPSNCITKSSTNCPDSLQSNFNNSLWSGKHK